MRRIDSRILVSLESEANELCELNETRIALETCENRLERGELVREFVELLRGPIEQRMFFKELPTAWHVYIAKRIAHGLKLGCKRIRRFTCEGGRFPIDDHEHRFFKVGEERREGRMVLSRREAL